MASLVLRMKELGGSRREFCVSRPVVSASEPSVMVGAAASESCKDCSFWSRMRKASRVAQLMRRVTTMSAPRKHAQRGRRS